MTGEAIAFLLLIWLVIGLMVIVYLSQQSQPKKPTIQQLASQQRRSDAARAARARKRYGPPPHPPSLSSPPPGQVNHAARLKRMREARANTPSSPPPLTRKAPVETVSGVVQNKLLRLCQYDNATAQRLVASIATRHPDKSLQWHWEKAIRDLERDRR